MSLLTKYTNADVVVFFDEEFTDSDGNPSRRVQAVGVPTRAVLQPARQSGTSARRAEQDNEGWETEEVYRLRFTREWDQTMPPLGQAAQVEWNGDRWSVIGLPAFYNGSRRTWHYDYQIRRT